MRDLALDRSCRDAIASKNILKGMIHEIYKMSRLINPIKRRINRIIILILWILRKSLLL